MAHNAQPKIDRIDSMYRRKTYNTISPKGLDRFERGAYEVGQDIAHPEALLLRSHKLQEEEILDSVTAIARAGAGVNNIPIAACSERGIPVFNTPGVNANAVKELVAAAMLLAARHCGRYCICPIAGPQYVGSGYARPDGSREKAFCRC